MFNMKKLILFFFSLTLFQSSAIAVDFPWKCEITNNSISSCIRSFKEDKEYNEFVGAETEMIYKGEISQNLPNGKGQIIFNHKKINEKFDRYASIGWLQKSSQGIFKTDPKTHDTKLLDGKNIYLSNVEEFRKNGETVKIKYSKGQTYSGKFFRDQDTSYPQLLEGTYEYKNSNDDVIKFEGKFILKKYKEEKRVINKFMNGKAFFKNGNTFKGTFYYNDFEINMMKEGEYTFKNGEKFIGIFDMKGSPKKGSYYFNNNDKYIGTFRNKNYFDGKYYLANGSSIVYKKGSSITSKTENLVKIKSNKIFQINIYLVFALIVIGIFLFYKFNDDKYVKKHNKRKPSLIEQITGFMNSPIGTGILMLIIGIALFNLFNWSTTDLEPGRPKFFGHDGG